MTTTTDLDDHGRRLRKEREAAGLTRAQLALLTGCSLTSLGNIEQGATPRRSRVLEEAFAAVARFNDERRAHEPGAVQDRAGRRERAPA